MLLILNNIDNLSLSDITLCNDKIFYQLNQTKINGIYFKYHKNLVNTEKYYLLKLDENIIPLFKYLNSEKRLKIIDNETYIELVKNKITTQIFNDKNDSLILNFKSVNHNNFIKIHIIQWKN